MERKKTTQVKSKVRKRKKNQEKGCAHKNNVLFLQPVSKDIKSLLTCT